MSEITQFQILNDEWVRYGDHLVEVERLTAERDEARAEVERLKEQVATLTVGMEWADKLKAYAEAAEAETDRVVADGNKALAEVERLTGERDAALAEVQRLTAERDTAQAEVERLTRAREALRDSLREALIERNDARYEAGQLRRDQSAQNLNTANGQAILDSSRPDDDHRAEVERLTAERDAALAEVERLIAERDTAQANVKWLIDRGNGKASLHRSRATDEDIWREAFMALCGQSLKEGYMIRAESADAALAVYRKRWPQWPEGFNVSNGCNAK
jgi:chromosome segregation ATPase